jgi:hypothetical protein
VAESNGKTTSLAKPSQRLRTLTIEVSLISSLVLFLSAVHASNAAAAAAPPDFFGISSIGQLASEDEQEEIQRLGARNVRNNFEWARVQPGASCDGNNASLGLNFSYYDDIIRRAAFRNITIIANLYGSRATCDVHPFPEPGTSMYRDWYFEAGPSWDGGYVWQLVQRYGIDGKFWQLNRDIPYRPIRIWEVWNEENLAINNPGYVVDPQKYKQLLIDTANTIRHAQEEQSGQSVEVTNTKVLMGGLAPFDEAMHVTDYMNSIYSSSRGATQFYNSFDGLSYHPYALRGNGADAVLKLDDARDALDQRRSALNGGSDSGKTLWITELGWPIGSFPNRDGSVTTINETQQANYLSQSFNSIYYNADAMKVKYVAWYVYKDGRAFCPEWRCWDKVSGLTSSHERGRLAWCTLSNMIVGSPMRLMENGLCPWNWTTLSSDWEGP